MLGTKGQHVPHGAALTAALGRASWQKSLATLQQAKLAGVEVNIVHLGATMASFGKAAKWEVAVALLSSIPLFEVPPNILVLNSLMMALDKLSLEDLAVAASLLGMARCKAIDVELEPEECAHLMAMRLIRGAVAEDCDVSKEMLKHDGCYEMEDDVLSLNGDSEDEGELVHFACGLASGALKQAMQLDLAKASWAAVQENTADFHEVRGFRDEEEEDDDFQEVHNTETGEFEVLASQNLTGTVLEVENSPADQVEMLRQEARDLLLKAAGNGRLAAVFKQRSLSGLPGHDGEKNKGEVRAYLVPDYLYNARQKGAVTIAVAGNQSVGKSSFLRVFMGNEQVTKPTTTREPVAYLYSSPSDIPCMLWDLPPLGAAGYPGDQYMALLGLRHFDLVVVMMDNTFSEAELLLLDELKHWKVPYVLVRNKMDVDIEREYMNEQSVWDARGVKDGLDDSIKAEILMDTMTTIKDDVSDLCGAERVYCISTQEAYRQSFDAPALMADLKTFINIRCTPKEPEEPLEERIVEAIADKVPETVQKRHSEEEDPSQTISVDQVEVLAEQRGEDQPVEDTVLALSRRSTHGRFVTPLRPPPRVTNTARPGMSGFSFVKFAIVGGLAHWLANFFNWTAILSTSNFWKTSHVDVKPKTAPGPTEALVRRQQRAQEEAEEAKKQFRRASQFFVNTREPSATHQESTGVVLNRSAPEIVSCARRRLEGALASLREANAELREAQADLRAYPVPDYLAPAQEQGAIMIGVTGYPGVGKSSWVNAVRRVSSPNDPDFAELFIAENPQHELAQPAMSEVSEIFSEAELHAVCRSHKGLTTLLLWAPWHPASVHLTKVLDAVAKEHPSTRFAKANVDLCASLASSMGADQD
eukprot:g17828.t1